MYRQILVDPSDRHLQKIVWRYTNDTDPKEHELNTVTYDLTCAPFLAMRTLRQLADDEGGRFPYGAEARLDTYMDDILTDAPTFGATKELQRQLSELCMAGGFPLRKWSANDADLLDEIPPDHRLQRDRLSWQPHESHATLGLQWHPSLDAFSFAIRSVAAQPATKRSVLSMTAWLFDPLGWLAPVIVRAKILFQSTWLLGIDWNTPLDEPNARLWRSYQADLPVLEAVIYHSEA